MSQVSWYRQFGLAITLALLGTLAYWLEVKHKPAKEQAEEQSKQIFQIKDTAVTSIGLLGGTVNSIVFTCSDLSAKLCKPGDNSKWEVSEPTRIKADDSNVNNLLTALNHLSSTSIIDLKDESPDKRASLLKDYGVDTQSRKTSKKVTLSTTSGETVLYLGSPHPIEDSVFAIREQVTPGQKVSGNADETHIYLIPNSFKTNLNHEFIYWRDKKLLTLGAHEVESFKLESSHDPVSADRKEGKWYLHVGKDELPGDIENIGSFLSSTTYLLAKDIILENKNDLKSKGILKGYSQSFQLSLQKEKGTAKDTPAPIILTLFQDKSTHSAGKVYATVSNLDPLFELDPGVQNRLNKSTKDLRLTKLLTAMERFSAKKLIFSGTPMGSTPLELLNENGKWLNATDKKEVSPLIVQSVLDQLSGNKIKEFLQSSSIPSGEKEGLKFTLIDEKGVANPQLIIWKKEDKFYARDLISKRNEAFLIDNSLGTALPWDRNFFNPPPLKTEKKTEASKK